MSSEDLSIRVEGLGKRYEIYARPSDRLKQMVLPRLQRAATGRARDYFREFWALRDVDFTVRRGETVGIIGRNGSGKSTLLQMVCGTLHPTTGSVEVRGRVAALLELGAGFNVEFTGRENVFLSGLLYGISESELRRRYPSIVAFADIGEFIDQPVKTYSSGMYVRLAFAIIAHVDADTLVVDEALSVGDARFTQKCMRFLREFQSRGTLLFVSHDTGAVVNLCQRAMWIDQGRVVVDGAARDVVERYLAEQHAAESAASGHVVKVRAASGASTPPQVQPAHSDGDGHVDDFDPRLGLLNGSVPGNRMKVFEFNPVHAGAEFGAGAVRIVDVSLRAAQAGRQLDFIDGGEVVDLLIEAEVTRALDAPIFGFYVKDRLGQQLFGDNTYLTYREQGLRAGAGERLCARFRFRMPILPVGDYTIDAAVASGTQDHHVQQHWIRDALVFKAGESSMRYGLIGVPMREIEIRHQEG